MYNQPEKLLEQYHIEIHQITKGRGTYICDTNQGALLLVPFRGSRERAHFLSGVLDKLNQSGYPAEQIICTPEGEPLVEDENGMRYWLKRMIAGSECTTGKESDMCQAIRQLAMLHRTVEECEIAVPEFMMNRRNDPQVVYERHLRELVSLKNYVKTRKKKNEFERSFWEQYPHYIADARQAVSVLNEPAEEVRYLLCHGDMNQHNVVRTAEGFRIIHYENMCYNMGVSDVANFLRKLLEKNNWNASLGIRLIDAYEQIYPMTQPERRMLYRIMLFPEKFWKISNHYANSHKAWVSQRDIEKLERIVQQENMRRIFLEKLFSII